MTRYFIVIILICFASCTEKTAEKTPTKNSKKAKYVRGQILHFIDDPATEKGVEKSYEYFQDGLMIIKDGRIDQIGDYNQLKGQIKDAGALHDHSGKLIMPGFIDTHIHYPQVEMIAAYGEQLLEWLDTYTFPTEKKYKDPAYADKMANFFFDELLKNGTTTALVFSSVHPQSTEAFFKESHLRNLRMISGKVMMDRNAPDYLLDNPESSYNDTKKLIEKWHKKGRQLYAVTPRFAPTSTPEQLTMAGKLMKEFPDVWMHTHLSENKGEIEWVKELFPEREGYLDVYDHYGLTGPRSVFAHAVHLTDKEWKTMKQTGSAISHCSTSNLFLGSGFFNLKKAEQLGVKVGIGSDVGAGTSISTFATLNEAYKIQQIQTNKLSAFKGFYLATLGGARSLELDEYIGNFKKGKEADFVVIDPEVTDLQKERISHSKSLEDKLFALMMLGDERNISATYIMGNQLYKK